MPYSHANCLHAEAMVRDCLHASCNTCLPAYVLPCSAGNHISPTLVQLYSGVLDHGQRTYKSTYKSRETLQVYTERPLHGSIRPHLPDTPENSAAAVGGSTRRSVREPCPA